MLIMRGITIGAQVGVGTSKNLGYVSLGEIPNMTVSPGPDLALTYTVSIPYRDIYITILADVLFDAGKAEIKAEPLALAQLGRIGKNILARPPERISIQGHTDNHYPANSKPVSEGAPRPWPDGLLAV
jgi:flagellar motor protein MotB